jgi:molecular chaperone GrpE
LSGLINWQVICGEDFLIVKNITTSLLKNFMAKKKATGKEEEKHGKAHHAKSHVEKEHTALKSEIEELKEKVKDKEDKYLRLAAEFDNYRKRTLKEKIELSKQAGEKIFESVLPVIDDFERALQLIDTSKDMEAMKNGIDLIYNKFRDFLAQNGVKEVEALDHEFNTELHEAVTKMSVTDKKLKGKVIDVISKGYMLNEKVIRFPKVVVGD